MEKLPSIENIKINDYILERICQLEERYHNYIKKINELDEKNKRLFLMAIKEIELETTQLMESQDTILTRMNIKKPGKSSIDAISELVMKGKKLTLEELNRIHDYLINGTEDDKEENHGYRRHEVQVYSIEYINKIQNGRIKREPKILNDKYIPPKPENIEKYTQDVLDYLNDDKSAQTTDTIFIKPFIVHALISILQPFGNGNTRLARLVQYSKIHEMTNKLFPDSKFDQPLLFLSENYKLTRGDYREKISNIANKQDNDSWIAWLNYNLNMVEERLGILERSIDSKLRMMKY